MTTTLEGCLTAGERRQPRHEAMGRLRREALTPETQLLVQLWALVSGRLGAAALARPDP